MDDTFTPEERHLIALWERHMYCVPSNQLIRRAEARRAVQSSPEPS